MAEYFNIIIEQVCVLFLMISLGFLLSKFKLIDLKGAKQLSNILLYLVSPCVILKAFQLEFTRENALGLFYSFVCAVISHIIMIFVTMALFSKKEESKKLVLKYSVIYSNCGFMCIPILYAVLGEKGVFYGALYIAIFTICQWTHGAALMGGGIKALSVKKIFLNPGVISVTAAIIIFIFNIKLPQIPLQTIEGVAELNTPLAMIMIGANIQHSRLSEAVKDVNIYAASVMRLIIFPVIMFLALFLFNFPKEIFIATIIQVSAPVSGGTVMFSTLFNRDQKLASNLVAFSTLLSVITMPLIISFSGELYS